MVERSEFLAELQKWQDEKVIKVVTGLRRCGKSTLLSMFQERLRSLYEESLLERDLWGLVGERHRA